MAELISNIRRGRAKPYDSVPRIDWSHPLAKSLAWYAYDAGGRVYDLANGNEKGTVFSSTTHGVRTQSKFGYGYKYPGTATSDTISLPNNKNAGGFANSATSPPFSIAAGVQQLVDGAFGGYLCSIGGPSFQDNCGFALGNTNIVNFLLSNGGLQQSYTTSFTYNVFHTLAGVATSTTAFSAYFDGKLDNSGTTGSTAFTNNQTDQQVCFNTGVPGANTFGGGMNGFVYYFAGWNRALSAIENALLHADPYCFLIYPEDELFATLVGVSVIDVLMSQIWL